MVLKSLLLRAAAAKSRHHTPKAKIEHDTQMKWFGSLYCFALLQNQVTQAHLACVTDGNSLVISVCESVQQIVF